jgi:hypothetical protein
MDVTIDDAVAVLESTPRALDALLAGVPAGFREGNEGGETWSPRIVVGHLVHGEETDWIPRARILLEHGESRPFEPFDRFAQIEKYGEASIDDLLRRFAVLRAGSLGVLRGWNLGPADLARRGRHPELGSVTLGQLLATWVAHDLDHLAQISRTMAKQYSAAVGPWKEFLSILK